jgi:hypothetical protein
MHSATEQAVESWRRAGLRTKPGVNRSLVKEAFQSVGRQASQDVLALYALCGGSEPIGEEDDNFFSFWPLQTAVESAREFPSPHYPFADGFVASYRYCFHFESADRSSVHIDADFSKLASSVEEFLLFFFTIGRDFGYHDAQHDVAQAAPNSVI